MITNQIRVLVFGTTGTGKTSICNALTGENRDTGNSAKGVSFEYYTSNPFHLENKSCIVTDTIGLNESSKGTVNSVMALKSLIGLLKNSKDGYSLLIQVIKAGRVTKDIEDNFHFFVKAVCDGKIPAILVVTGCENSEPMDRWVIENEGTIKRMGLDYKAMLATCFGESQIEDFKRRFASKKEESIDLLKEAIIKYSAATPVRIYETSRGLSLVIKRSWNWFCDFIGISQWRYKINEKLQELLLRVGLSYKEAEEVAADWDKK